MSVIIVFEDIKEENDEIRNGLKKRLGNQAEVISFDSSNTPLIPDTSFEFYITSWIESRVRNKRIALIVCDKELGRSKNLPGLSATSVSRVALEKGIPFCQYSRQASKTVQSFAKYKCLRQWSSDEITLKGNDTEEWIKETSDLFKGFELIFSKYNKLKKKKIETPPSILSQILQHPETESRIALYGSGEQGFLKEIFISYDQKDHLNKGLHNRMPRILGNWLYLSILRFPGILVNLTSAASYLNIAEQDFNKQKIRDLFKNAIYKGPFSELGPWWWRDELDLLISKDGSKDGKEYARKKHIKVNTCLDPQTKKKAGFYCMLTEKPVSKENSRGRINWFPSGADLARIRKDIFEQITAMIGMY